MWYQISLDELQHNEIIYHRDVVEPGAQARMLVEMMLREVLRQLGVDIAGTDDEIVEQQLALGIDIREMDEAQLRHLCAMTKNQYSPKSLGFYIYQYDTPMCFISDPYIHNRTVKVSVEPFHDKIRFTEAEFQMARMRGDA